MPSITRIIQLAPVACYLASSRTAKGSLFGPPVDPKVPILIFGIHKILKKIYDQDPTYTGLRVVADYLYELMQRYAFKAAGIVDNSLGGQVAAQTGTVVVQPYDFEVTDDTIIPDGGTSVVLERFRGLNINFRRGGISQNTTNLNDGSSYYSWNPVTAVFSIFPSATGRNGDVTGELFRIEPDNIGATAITVSNPNIPDTIILSADGTYTLLEGYQIWKITISPSVADTVRIGTSANGEQIMMDKVMVINTYANNGVTYDVFAESGNQTIYFTGFTGAATINIYTLPI